jgi:hypothetical protein
MTRANHHPKTASAGREREGITRWARHRIAFELMGRSAAQVHSDPDG